MKRDVLRPLLPRHDAERGLGDREPPHVQRAGRQSALTLPYLVPALDSLPWIQKNRRIFFLGSWLGGFIGGQQSPEALAEIDAFLARPPKLPLDLRQKILQTRDDLERTVRIRAQVRRRSGISRRAAA